MKKHQIVYTLISPDGTSDVIGPIIMYATAKSILIQRLDKELRRRMGNLYQWEIEIQQIEEEQLALFELT